MNNLSEKTGIRAEILERMKSELEKFGATRAVIYGSRGRGDFKDPSDVDLAYWGDKENEAKIWLAMEELPTIHKIDLVHFETLTNEDLKKNILRDGIDLL